MLLKLEIIQEPLLMQQVEQQTGRVIELTFLVIQELRETKIQLDLKELKDLKVE
jgi:hypothetical protein